MENLRPIFLFLFPMVGELHRAPVRDVAIFSFAEYAVEHSRGTKQADMSTMQRRERTSSDVSLHGEENSSGLTVCCRIQQQILHFIERNPGMGERCCSRARNFVSHCGRLTKNLKI